MNIPKEKRNQLLLVAIITVAVMVLIGLTFINPQLQTLSKIKANKRAAQAKLQQINDTIKHMDAAESELAAVSNALSHAEEDMASGDIYSWTYDTIRRFKVPYQVDIPQIGQPELSDVDLLPNFPYKQVKFTVNGTAYYHDFGKFIAAFENTFPHIRIVNLTMDPIPSGPDGSTEKLSFRMDIVALIKSNSS
jgi:Tfp pilus assembly protein PilO